MVKLLACRARGLGFDSPPRYLNFREWLSHTSKLRYGWNTAKVTLTNPQYDQPIKANPLTAFFLAYWILRSEVRVLPSPFRENFSGSAPARLVCFMVIRSLLQSDCKFTNIHKCQEFKKNCQIIIQYILSFCVCCCSFLCPRPERSAGASSI